MNKFKTLFLVAVFSQLTKISSAQVPSTWTVNPSGYTYQMSVTAKANEACVDWMSKDADNMRAYDWAVQQ